MDNNIEFNVNERLEGKICKFSGKYDSSKTIQEENVFLMQMQLDEVNALME